MILTSNNHCDIDILYPNQDNIKHDAESRIAIIHFRFNKDILRI